MPSALSTTRETQRLQTRARVFDAAVAEIGRSGLAGADVAAIASAAGVSRGTFYFHFPTKEHVLVELERAEEVNIVSKLGTATTGLGDLVSMLKLLVRQVLAAERRLGPVVFRDMLGLHFSATRPEADVLAAHPVAEYVIAAIAEGRAAGRVAGDADPSELGVIFLSGLYALLATGDRASRARTALLDRYVKTIVRGNGGAMSDSGIEGYREFLARRDGDADLLHRRLARREEFFSALEADPVRSTHHVDREVFLRNLRRRRPEPGVEPKTLFLLATAKLNQAERFGVDLGDTFGRIGREGEPPERVYIALEEFYHTRLLAYVLDIFGLPFQVVVPPFVMRQFVKINVFLPERWRFAFVGAAEMVGCIMFDELRRVGVELFADEPDVAARIERLYAEILTDEVGHVGYCAASCTEAERTLMRWFYPRIGRLAARQSDEIRVLVDGDKLRARLARPFDVEALTADLPNETFLAAHP